jgi:hypothetical protein
VIGQHFRQAPIQSLFRSSQRTAFPEGGRLSRLAQVFEVHESGEAGNSGNGQRNK